MLSLPRLHLLSELHRRGTIAATARALSYTPSAVSQQLSQLERETGVPLLEKVGRGVRLTSDAITLVTHAKVVFAQLEQAEADLASAQPDLRGTLTVASFQSVVLVLAPAALRLLAERHPLLRVDITQREVVPAYEGLLSHEFDLILGEEYPGLAGGTREGIDRADLLADPLCLALPLEGPYATRPHRLSDLSDIPWALDPADTPTGQWARVICQKAGFEPRVQFDSPDPLLHAHLVRSELAAAVIPTLLGAEHLTGTRLVALPGDPHRVLYTAVRTGRARHPAVLAFRAALAEALAAQRPITPSWSILDG